MTNPSSDLATLVLALAKDMTRFGDQLLKIDDVVTAVPGLVDEIKELRTRLDQAQENNEDDTTGPTMWDWTTMDQVQAAAAWTTLIDWVETVLCQQYKAVGTTGGGRRQIPPCWYLHSDVVAEMSWLCQEWLRIYRNKGKPASAGEWHDRWLPGVIRRVHASSSASTCAGNQDHRDPYGNPIPYDDLEILRATVSADLINRPEPTTAAE